MTPQQLNTMKLALEALEGFYEYGYDRQECFEHITAIKEALAEHAMREVQRLGQEIEQEPVVYQCPRCATSMQVDLTAKAALAQEQEPVAWMHTKLDGVVVPHQPADLSRHPDRWEALYKTPPPCPTCEALARTVMLDQTGRDA